MRELLKIEVLFQLLPPNVQDADGLDCRGCWGYAEILLIKLMSMTLSSSKQQSKTQQLKLDRLEQKIGCAFFTARGSYLSEARRYAEVPVTELQTKPAYLLK